MGKTLENKFFNILSSLDSIWAKIAIIGIFVCTGFKFGCYYNNGSLKFEITAKRLYAASQRVL